MQDTDHRGRVDGQVTVIIGGSSGFGLATAERLAEEGATVIIAGRRGDAAEEAAAPLGGWGMACDATDHDSVGALVDAVVERHGTVDIGMNCAGYARSTRIADLTPDVLQPMVDVQFVGAIWAMKHLCNAMAASGGGSMINVSSLTAHNPSPGHAAYAGSKAGIEYVTRIAAVEYGAGNVRVNTIAAHLIETPMTAGLFQDRIKLEAVRQQTPLGRMGDVRDIANCALYLASDEGAYVSGETINVDGAASSQKLPSTAEYDMIEQTRPDLRD
jgi:NAD(P)-dependent dehydrogenase (short-subunit alcohol dehydrogenase family)